MSEYHNFIPSKFFKYIVLPDKWLKNERETCTLFCTVKVYPFYFQNVSITWASAVCTHILWTVFACESAAEVSLSQLLLVWPVVRSSFLFQRGPLIKADTFYFLCQTNVLMLKGCCCCWNTVNIKEASLREQDNDCPHSDNKHMHSCISNELHNEWALVMNNNNLY